MFTLTEFLIPLRRRFSTSFKRSQSIIQGGRPHNSPPLSQFCLYHSLSPDEKDGQHFLLGGRALSSKQFCSARIKPRNKSDVCTNSELIYIQRKHQHSSSSKSNATNFDGETSQEALKDNTPKGSHDDYFLSEQTRRQIEAIWTQSQSVPNIITITRIFSTPFISYLIISGEYKYAVVGCVAAGFSDWLDGYIARKFNQSTVLGTYLDPLADKIFINCIALSLGYVDIIPFWCASLWLGRDTILIGMAYRAAAIAAEGKGHNVADPSRTPLKIKASMVSKVNTLLQFGTIWTGLGFAAIGDVGASVPLSLGSASLTAIDGMCYLSSGTTVWSGLGYLDGKAMTASGNRSAPPDRK